MHEALIQENKKDLKFVREGWNFWFSMWKKVIHNSHYKIKQGKDKLYIKSKTIKV